MRRHQVGAYVVYPIGAMLSSYVALGLMPKAVDWWTALQALVVFVILMGITLWVSYRMIETSKYP